MGAYGHGALAEEAAGSDEERWALGDARRGAESPSPREPTAIAHAPLESPAASTAGAESTPDVCSHHSPTQTQGFKARLRQGIRLY